MFVVYNNLFKTLYLKKNMKKSLLSVFLALCMFPSLLKAKDDLKFEKISSTTIPIKVYNQTKNSIVRTNNTQIIAYESSGDHKSDPNLMIEIMPENWNLEKAVSLDQLPSINPSASYLYLISPKRIITIQSYEEAYIFEAKFSDRFLKGHWEKLIRPEDHPNYARAKVAEIALRLLWKESWSEKRTESRVRIALEDVASLISKEFPEAYKNSTIEDQMIMLAENSRVLQIKFDIPAKTRYMTARRFYFKVIPDQENIKCPHCNSWFEYPTTIENQFVVLVGNLSILEGSQQLQAGTSKIRMPIFLNQRKPSDYSDFSLSIPKSWKIDKKSASEDDLIFNIITPDSKEIYLRRSKKPFEEIYEEIRNEIEERTDNFYEINIEKEHYLPYQKRTGHLFLVTTASPKKESTREIYIFFTDKGYSYLVAGRSDKEKFEKTNKDVETLLNSINLK